MSVSSGSLVIGRCDIGLDGFAEADGQLLRGVGRDALRRIRHERIGGKRTVSTSFRNCSGSITPGSTTNGIPSSWLMRVMNFTRSSSRISAAMES